MSDSTALADGDWFADGIATFGDRVAGAREALGLSQAELAEKLGIKVTTLDDWEHDQSEPRSNRMNLLAGVLNVSLRWLMTGEGEGVGAPAGAEATPEIARILVELREVRGDMTRASDRLGQLEFRLRQTLKELT